jgi:phospho-N-acetylmuramoyl-pentapeptide-transferase
MIRKLREFQIGQVIRQEGPTSHRPKAGTPTMGGLLILTASLVPTLLWARLNNPYVWIAVMSTAGFGAIGFLDDYLKIIRHTHHGLRPRYKVGLQILLGAAVGAVLLVLKQQQLYNTRLVFPFFKTLIPDLGIFYLPFATFVLVAESNAVNLTDGLDGLATGPVIICSFTFLLLAYAAGTTLKGFNIAEYLGMPHVPGAGELAVFCGAMGGAGIGFLWFNTHPAQVFMGDVGALALGGALGFVALATKTELALPIIGGLFVAEAVSDVIQVAYYKKTKKRIFLMAPIHHHFEKLGWPESRIVVRFWIVSFACAILGLITILKVR